MIAEAEGGTAQTSDGMGTRLTLRLAHRYPLAASEVIRFHTTRAVPGVEAPITDPHRDPTIPLGFARVLDLPHGPATAALIPTAEHVACQLHLSQVTDLAPAVAACRRLLDLDADPVAVDGHLGDDPVLGPLVAARPGLRVPGAADGAELAIRAVLGQQVSVAAARGLAGRLVADHGTPLPEDLIHGGGDLRGDDDGGSGRLEDRLTHRFPRPAELAALDPATLPLPRRRAETIVALATELAEGDARPDAGADAAAVRYRLAAIPGIGPWTEGYVAMRALGDPDIWLGEDLVIRRHLADLIGPSADVGAIVDRWAPWRSYATIHLWRHQPTSAFWRRSAT